MAKKNKKVVKGNSLEDTRAKSKKVLVKTKSTSTSSAAHSNVATPMVFGKENYKWVGIGLVLITAGMLLMLGGFNENPSEWDENLIYSFRRVTLAPIVILAGLGVQIYAIFR